MKNKDPQRIFEIKKKKNGKTQDLKQSSGSENRKNAKKKKYQDS